jgi:ankyrin repeat protein
MPKSSDNSAQPLTAQSLPDNASLGNLRKQAKTLLKAVRAGDKDALARVHAFHPKPDPMRTSLSNAQLVIARSYGFSSWSKLKQHFDVIAEYSSLPDALTAFDESESLVDRFVSLACLNYTNDHTSRRDLAHELFAVNPKLVQQNIYAAATVGDVAVVRELLVNDPLLARRRGGPHNWEPLLYAAYSRFNSNEVGHSTLEVARLLLQHGADPNAGFLWNRFYLFTALTGVFGEGERGRIHQPPHQYCEELARALLSAGADPNDSQTLYNRMFTGGTDHLKLLFEFGLGKSTDGVWYKRLGGRLDSPTELLQQQLAWAVKYNQRERLEWLLDHGADVNRPDRRFKRTPHELALLSGNIETADYLVAHGAKAVQLNDLDAFSAACLNADGVQARSLLARDPTLVRQLGTERVELLNLAAESDKRDAIRLMSELGFDLNERKRTVPLHLAAGCGHLEMVKLLIELGADPAVCDEEFGGTALGWAHYSGKVEVMEFLKSLESV